MVVPVLVDVMSADVSLQIVRPGIAMLLVRAERTGILHQYSIQKQNGLLTRYILDSGGLGHA